MPLSKEAQLAFLILGASATVYSLATIKAKNKFALVYPSIIGLAFSFATLNSS